MTDQDDEDLQMALRLSMQSSPPEPKRSKPRDIPLDGISGSSVTESPEAKSRRVQRELMVAAAEKRMRAAKMAVAEAAAAKAMPEGATSCSVEEGEKYSSDGPLSDGCTGSLISTVSSSALDCGQEISVDEANQLFSMIFGNSTSKEILGQWTNQGIRFSSDPETSMGLVQHEGGPCGVLAAIQGFVIKYLLFSRDASANVASKMQWKMDPGNTSSKDSSVPDILASLSEDMIKRALVKSIGEMLFRCGMNKRAVIVTLVVLNDSAVSASDGPMDELISKELEGLSIESASDLHKTLSITTYTSYPDAIKRLEEMLPAFRSRMGAMLFLVSALLSRGLDAIQDDRDDPSLPLVTAPFGHASQEIVNLLLCGEAVANVFDDKIDLGGGMFLKGISKKVEVGFLTLLESLNFCKVGQHLKQPKWPIWVVGSESHYTVLFALEITVQDENEIEERESRIKRAFDNQDQSGGGGFISVEGFHQVLRETDIKLSQEKLNQLCNSGFIVWSEFWQILLNLDKNVGGLKDSSGLMGKKVFDLYHFNGIAKSVSSNSMGLGSGSAAAGEMEIPVQRPRLTKLRVSVPPKWTPEEYMSSDKGASSGAESGQASSGPPEPSQHAPLVDCIRTRWPRATCNWVGDPPSIV